MRAQSSRLVTRSASCFALVLGLVLGLGLAGTAHADDVYLKSGGKLEGKVTETDDSIVLVTRQGTVTFARDEVDRVVPGKTTHEFYLEHRATLDLSSADTQVELGDWCKERELDREARHHFRRAVELDRDHAAGRARLGHIHYDDRWMTVDEYRRARGFVKVDGEWVDRDEQRRRDADRRIEAEFKAHTNKIRTCVARMASKKRAKRLAAKLELQEYAESREDFALGAFASEVADYYNGQWRIIRNSARVRTTVQATHSQLKRPIPTLSTSLGAFTTPVTVQLPELSIVSVKTTVDIPAGIELDED